MQVDFRKNGGQMKSCILVAYLILLCACSTVSAQVIETYSDAWFLWHHQQQLDEKWSFRNEFHWRSTRFLASKEQLLIRPSINFRSNKILSYGLGYSYIRSYPFTDEIPSITRVEHNFWEQVVLKHQLAKSVLSHRFRIEHRFRDQIKLDTQGNFRTDGHGFSNRLRYRISIRKPLASEFYLHIFNELWIIGNKVFQQVNFDRNWFYVGLGREVSDQFSIEFSYLHQLIRISEMKYQRHPTTQLSIKTTF